MIMKKTVYLYEEGNETESKFKLYIIISCIWILELNVKWTKYLTNNVRDYIHDLVVSRISLNSNQNSNRK